ncbi:hypothetical protein DID77_02675 [Candidatus Marinamargulisbacteria bacterium SCGC AG-439-L15]|nr:hypothetical protein DID77_02675 [Candidatus Marinamargulisbacteria bacterium SCGC AG-439-L15]
MTPLNIIILAAGKGTRMKSELPKVAHKVNDIPMIDYVINASKSAGASEIYIVIGHQAETLKTLINDNTLIYVEQKEQLGTGHAVQQVAPHIKESTNSITMVLAGDCPLISAQTLKALLETHHSTQAKASILTTKLDDPAAYGRILKNEHGQVIAIREAKDCTEDELKVSEINSGIYCFDTQKLFNALEKTNTNNKQGEYYLTDVIEILKQDGGTISAYCTKNSHEVLGVNTKEDLRHIETLAQKINVPHST